MIPRKCKGCGIAFQVPEPPARGSSREWCTEACNRRAQRDRRTLELCSILDVKPDQTAEVRRALAAALDFLGPEIARARERERVRLERLQPPKPARKPRARKGAPRTT